MRKLFGRKGLSVSLPLGSGHKVRIEDTDDLDEMKGITVSRDFNHALPLLVERFKNLCKAFEELCPGKKLLCTCTFRSKEYQRKLFTQGRFGNPGPIVTNCDGFNTPSRHNAFPSEAIDFAIINVGKIAWPDTQEELYWPLIKLAAVHGLVYGGAWTRFPDWCHAEIRREDVKKIEGGKT